MANFNLVVDSTFQPFSYERYLQPIQAYAEEYKQQEQAANALARDLADVQASLSTETDADTLEYLKNYENQLRSKVDQLAEVGLTPTSRKEIYDLNTAYGQQVMPVVNAYNTRTKMIEDWYTNQDKYAYKDDPRTMSLMKIMGNPTANEKGSLDMLNKAGSDWAKSLSEELRGVTDRWGSLDNFEKNVIYQQLYQKYGLSSDQINGFIHGRISNESLDTLVNTVLKTQGVDESWMDYGKARSVVEASLHNAIGTDTYLSKFIPLGSSGSGSGSDSDKIKNSNWRMMGNVETDPEYVDLVERVNTALSDEFLDRAVTGAAPSSAYTPYAENTPNTGDVWEKSVDYGKWRNGEPLSEERSKEFNQNLYNKLVVQLGDDIDDYFPKDKDGNIKNITYEQYKDIVTKYRNDKADNLQRVTNTYYDDMTKNEAIFKRFRDSLRVGSDTDVAVDAIYKKEKNKPRESLETGNVKNILDKRKNGNITFTLKDGFSFVFEDEKGVEYTLKGLKFKNLFNSQAEVAQAEEYYKKALEHKNDSLGSMYIDLLINMVTDDAVTRGYAQGETSSTNLGS